MKYLYLAATIDERQLRELEQALSHAPGRIRQAIRTGINGTVRWAHRTIVRTITRRTTLKRADIVAGHRWSGVEMKLASGDELAGGVIVSGARIPLIWFRHRQLPGRTVTWTDARGRKRTMRTWSGGVAYQIMRQGEMKTFLPAWIGSAVRGKRATAKESASGHVAVFYRSPKQKVTTRRIAARGSTAKEHPVRQKHGPSLPAIATFDPYIKEAFALDLDRELRTRIEARIARAIARRAAVEGAEAAQEA